MLTQNNLAPYSLHLTRNTLTLILFDICMGLLPRIDNVNVAGGNAEPQKYAFSLRLKLSLV